MAEAKIVRVPGHTVKRVPVGGGVVVVLRNLGAAPAMMEVSLDTKEFEGFTVDE